MLKLGQLLGLNHDVNDVKQDIENIPESIIEDIILEEQEELGKVRRTTTRYLRSKYGSDIVNRTLRRLDKRRQREKPKTKSNLNLSDLGKLLNKTIKTKEGIEVTFKDKDNNLETNLDNKEYVDSLISRCMKLEVDVQEIDFEDDVLSDDEEEINFATKI